MIYFDSAATSLYKPPQVGEAMLKALKCCASPGRGGHPAAMRGAEVLYSCREEAAKLFHVSTPEQVIFTSSATHGLNLAIRSLIKPGDRVVISGYEHNAVVRPLHALGAIMDPVNTSLFDSKAMVQEFERKVPGAAAVICIHVSNVFGYILPVRQIALICHRYGVPMIVDAAQSAGVLDIDFQGLGVDYVAMPGHKGLLGPQGTGILLCKNGGEPLLYGGTGSNSAMLGMPDDIPDRLEAGTHNVCGIAGLKAGIQYVLKKNTCEIKRHEDQLLTALINSLNQPGKINIIYANTPELQCGVLSVIPANEDCEVYAEKMGQYGVAVRAGLHCAPLAHKTAGTFRTGTIRFSISPFNSMDDIIRLTHVIHKI